ncbi:hypothetical protein SEMRO_1999_G310150.1 [Seminavis robusta]|uniref:Uncharacterized protein n=1 Tax=Seminavis robusta TaxID=568900 RepID=A0A9N8EVH1_9STRA|nr:hypothetical protein SEMRO_1999_G310150.1 [Seminavis robusta]|eukprot:Sro1999_g310150.1 n/a (213) ;mRNA; f:5445-6083
MTSLCNEEVKIAFFSKATAKATAVSTDTLSKIAQGVKCGLRRCQDRQADVDMFVCVQGNKYIPNNLPICLEDVNATMEQTANGNLTLKTLTGGHFLHVIFTSGGSQFRLVDRQPPRAQQPAPPRPPPRPQQPPRRNNMAPPQRRRTPMENAKVRNRSSSDSSSEEEIVPAPRRQRTVARAQQKQQQLDDSDDFSSAEEYQNFSQLTGRAKRS